MFYVCIVFMIFILFILFFIRKQKNSKVNNMRYGTQIYDDNGREIFNSTKLPFKFIDKKIVFEGENTIFNYSLSNYKLVAWLVPMQSIVDQRVFIKVEGNSIVVKSNTNTIDRSIRYIIFIGAY